MADFKLNPDDMGLLCICAIRYCQGRETYMPDKVRGIVRPLLDKLTDRDLRVMLEDCDFQARMKLYGNDRIDKPGWIKWREELENERNRRASDAVPEL